MLGLCCSAICYLQCRCRSRWHVLQMKAFAFNSGPPVIKIVDLDLVDLAVGH